jgi:hypothetical protein
MATAPAKKTPAKPAASKAAAKPATKAAPQSGASSAPKTAAPKEPKVQLETTKPTTGATLKSKDLVARVAEAMGGKVKDVRETVLATLDALGKSIDAGEVLTLPPLGKLRLIPVKGDKTPGALRLKLQRVTGAKADKKDDKKEGAEGLAAAGEAS